jgi:hypothetical protein
MPPSTGQGSINLYLRNPGRTFQSYYVADKIGGLGADPVYLTSLRLARASKGSNNGVADNVAAPAQNLNFNNYTITLSKGSTQLGISYTSSPTGDIFRDINGNLSTSFQSHLGPNPTVVYNGALTIPAGSLGAVGNVGLLLDFTTPYVHTPGDPILVTVQHSGHGAGDANDVFVLTTLHTQAPLSNGIRTAQALNNNGLNQNPTGIQGSGTAQVRFDSSPVPEPTTLAALGGAAVVTLRRRRG